MGHDSGKGNKKVKVERKTLVLFRHPNVFCHLMTLLPNSKTFGIVVPTHFALHKGLSDRSTKKAETTTLVSYSVKRRPLNFPYVIQVASLKTIHIGDLTFSVHFWRGDGQYTNAYVSEVYKCQDETYLFNIAPILGDNLFQPRSEACTALLDERQVEVGSGLADSCHQLVLCRELDS